MLRSRPEAGMEREETRRSRWTWVIPLGLVGLIVVAYFVWPAYREFVRGALDVFASGEQDRIEEWVQGFGTWGYAVMVGLMLMQTILAFLPSFVLMVVAVIAFGPVNGGLLAWGGMLLAATLGYGIGRGLGETVVDRLIGAKTQRTVSQVVDRYGTWAVVAARISPVLSSDAVSIVAGLSRMRFVRFIIATALGTLPLIVLIAWFGSESGRMKPGLIWVSVISVAVFGAYVVWDWRRR
ncbi:MAG TPA: TVP38/TMEM64 family protein [Rhodothermales bacterium]